MNYELFMGEALAEAQLAASRGERPIAAVAVVDEAMVARAHDRVEANNDPTAHAWSWPCARPRAASAHPPGRCDDLLDPGTLRDVRRALLESDVEASSTRSRTTATAPRAR
jgi:hypothetical protein